METLCAPRGRHRPSLLESQPSHAKAVRPARTRTLKTPTCSNAGAYAGQGERNISHLLAGTSSTRTTRGRRPHEAWEESTTPPPTPSRSLGAPRPHRPHRGYCFPPHGRKSSSHCSAEARGLQPSSGHVLSQRQASLRQSAVPRAAFVPRAMSHVPRSPGATGSFLGAEF